MTDKKLELLLRSQKGKKELLKAYNRRYQAQDNVKEVKEGWVSRIMSKLKRAEVVE